MISNNWKTLAALSLERAKAAPLEIHLDIHEIRGDPQFLNLLTPLKSVPNLRSLSLSDDGVGVWDQSIDPFELSARALQYLSLNGIPLYPSFLDLRTLTELGIHDYRFNLYLDTRPDFLEQNRSLTRAAIEIRFMEPSLRHSRQERVKNKHFHSSAA